MNNRIHISRRIAKSRKWARLFFSFIGWACLWNLTASLSRATDLTVSGNLYVNYDATSGNLITNGSLIINGTGFGGALDFSGSDYMLNFAGNFSGTGLVFNSTTATSWTLDSSNLSVGSFSMGPWYNGTEDWDGVLFSFVDLENETSGNIYQIASSPEANWSWSQYYDDQTTMNLDARGNLTLTSSGNFNSIVVNPAKSTITLNTSGGLSDIIYLTSSGGVVNGIGYGYVSLDDSNSDLPTVYFGSDLISGNSSSGNLIFGGTYGTEYLGYTGFNPYDQSLSFTSYTDYYPNITINGNDTALAFAAISLGNSYAHGNDSVAIGYDSSTYGNMAIALGNVSVASGNNSIALDGGNTTSDNTLAIGNNATTSAQGAVAIGPASTAQAWGTVVVGYNDQPISGCLTQWQSGDPALIAGIGNSTTVANGLVIYNSGNAAFNGTAILSNPAYVSPTSPTQPQELQVNGASIFNGTTTFNGTVTLSATQSLGDVLMGTFAH